MRTRAGGGPWLSRPEIVLVAAPDAGFRHSLAFALASGGFDAKAHAQAAEAFASRHAWEAACAVIDDDAVADWRLAPVQFRQFGRPVILLVSFLHAAPALPLVRPLAKPFLGEPLIEAVRNAIIGLV